MWRNRLKADPLPWLMQDDPPGIRYSAMEHLIGPNDRDQEEYEEAKSKAYREGPIAAILENIEAEGYWTKPGPGYNPKYRSTVWSLILLAQLGAKASDDERIGLACQYLLDHA